ncbi:MAG: hypothetical protein CK427_14265 [Leptospira sp.]|nr:MAG: hypothetical protein CK427_14265 [Leptospira sp.]
MGESILPQIYFQLGAWLESTLSSNGKVYLFSGIADRPVLVVDIGETFCDSVLLSSYFNNN